MLPAVLVGAFFIFFCWTGLAAIDFGFHWDEKANILIPLRDSILSGVPWPHWYYFPSICHDLAVVSLGFQSLSSLSAGQEPLQTVLLNTLHRGDFLLQTRSLFLVLAGLAICWVYLATLHWRKNHPEALFSAALIAFSWEFAYHARWLTADPLATQWVALTLLFTILALKKRSVPWIYFGAISSGGALATKYPVGLIFLPVLLVVFLEPPSHRYKRIFQVFGLFILTFFLTTPGALVEPGIFIHDIFYQIKLYGTAHGGYTVSRGPEHLGRMLIYLGGVAFSQSLPTALVFSGLGLLGITDLLRNNKKEALVFLSFPLVYLLYFSSQKVMIVRNLLVLLPFLAAASARGFSILQHKLPSATRKVSAFFFVMLFLLNAAWLVYAMRTIQTRHASDQAAQLALMIDRNPKLHFWISRRVKEALGNPEGAPRSNVMEAPGAASDLAVFYSSEVQPWTRWSANHPRYFFRWFGPQEVNLNYYPSWAGDDRIVILRMEEAKNLGIFGDHFLAKAGQSITS